MPKDFILQREACSKCVFDEFGDYNTMCVHCPNKMYSKRTESSFITREMAETLNIVLPKENKDE